MMTMGFKHDELYCGEIAFKIGHLQGPRTMLYHPFFALSMDNYLLLESTYSLESVSLANIFNQALAVEPFLEERDDKGRTALHKASESGNLSQVIELLEQGAKINTEDNDWKRPLHLAAESGAEALVRYLLRKGADVHGADSENRHALHLAAQRGHDKVVLCLLLGGAKINARDARGRTALHHAAVTGQDEVIGVLVKEGANRDMVDENKNAAWNLAWNGGLMSTQKLLLTINQRWNLGAEMINAIMAKDLTSLQKKLDEGLDPNFKTKAGISLLFHVAFAGKNNNDMVFSEMAKLLLDRGADVHAKSLKGATPLHYAIAAKDYATMKVLLERGADVNVKNRYGYGPLDCTLNDPDAHRLLQSYANQGSQRGFPIRQTR
jgi:ankyrin repeat protein